jgi:hypothetical protein
LPSQEHPTVIQPSAAVLGAVPNAISYVLYIGGGGFLLGGVFGLLIPRGGRIAILGLGLALATAFVLTLYFMAPSDGRHDCSDCYESLGRWWLPRLAVVLALLNLAGWIFGARIGQRMRLRRSSNANRR